MKQFLFLALCLGLAGCATTAGYEAVLDTWVGDSETALISSWGYPNNAYVMVNGQRVIQYVQEENMQTGGGTYEELQRIYDTQGDIYVDGTHAGTYSGGVTQVVTKQKPIYNLLIWCKTTFIITSSGIIERWKWEGNNCRAVAPQKPKKIINEINKQEEIQDNPSSGKLKGAINSFTFDDILGVRYAPR